MKHRAGKALAPLVALAVVVVGCDSDAPAEPDPAAEQETEAEAEPTGPAATEPAVEDETEPEPEEPASAEEVAASAEGPSAFEEQPQADGGHPALQYVIELSLLIDQPDSTPELDRIDTTTFQSATTRVWFKRVDDQLQDAAVVVVADFGSAEDAAAEFAHLRTLADERVAGGATEIDAGLSGEESFAVAAAFGMVPIGPDGEPEREPPIATLGVIRSGQFVVLVSTSINDGPTDGSGAFAELARSLEL